MPFDKELFSDSVNSSTGDVSESLIDCEEAAIFDFAAALENKSEQARPDRELQSVFSKIDNATTPRDFTSIGNELSLLKDGSIFNAAPSNKNSTMLSNFSIFPEDTEYLYDQETQPSSADSNPCFAEQPQLEDVSLSSSDSSFWVTGSVEEKQYEQTFMNLIQSYNNSLPCIQNSLPAVDSVLPIGKDPIQDPVQRSIKNNHESTSARYEFETKNFSPSGDSFDKIFSLYDKYVMDHNSNQTRENLINNIVPADDEFIGKAFSYITERVFAGLGYTKIDTRVNVVPSTSSIEFFEEHIICKTLPASANKNALKIHESGSRRHLARILSLSENSLVVIEQIIEEIALLLKIRISGERLSKAQKAEYKRTHNGQTAPKETWLGQPKDAQNRMYKVCIEAFRTTFGFNVKVVEFFLRKIGTSNSQNLSKSKKKAASQIRRHRKNILLNKPKVSVYTKGKKSQRV